MLAEERFQRTVDGFRDAYVALWNRSRPVAPRARTTYGPREKRANERRNDALMVELEERFGRYPRGSDALAGDRWRSDLKRTLRDSGRSGLGVNDGYLATLLSDESFEVTRDFVLEARAFEPDVPVEDLFQALRNVWIANTIQLLLDRPVELTPAIFAYSMLYPCSDNVLDDPELPRAAKEALNARFGRRLAGERLAARDAHERRLFALVERIEDQFPRRRHPDVHQSLRAIHRGQMRSLEQQGCADARLLLAISVEKGGASVLADGYLVAGELDPHAAFFLFGYGVFLQLLDDLQDVRADRANGHGTVFSRLAGAEPLDDAAARLLVFLRAVLAEAPDFGRVAELKELIRRNGELLYLHAVAENADLYSPGFLAALEPLSPVSLSYLRRLRRRLAVRYRRIAASFGTGSVFEVLGEAG